MELEWLSPAQTERNNSQQGVVGSAKFNVGWCWQFYANGRHNSQQGVVGSADVGWCWQLCANRRNNS